MSRALALVDPSDEQRQHEKQNPASPLLETKLYVPRSRSALVARPRLTSAISEGAAQKLTIVVAPAGFGKTTLLSSWLADTGGQVGWVSLDGTENEPALFWSYVIRALQRARGGLGAGALQLLQSPQPPPIRSVLIALMNDIDGEDRDFTLVLDDYHVIDSDAVHVDLSFFIDRMPARMHVAIASRSEPPLPLPRLRARGELTELRAADLRFTPDEATAFFNEVMALKLSATDAAKLGQHTEGWIAALKLAALSLKGRHDVASFVASFSGDHRHIADYLVEEVVRSEPPHVQRFLLATAILNRMNGRLCDAVTGETGSGAILDDLERRGLFVVALDDRREWYRYHHLFADVLQKLTTDAAAARESHRRASAWYEQQGLQADAVRHALAAQDFERAARLLERMWPEKNRSYESARWLDRIKTLPEAVIRKRPVLSMGYAWSLLNGGELEAAEARLRDAQRLLQADRSEIVVDDEERFRALDAELATARVYLAQSRGDAPGTIEHAQRLLSEIPDDDHAGRATSLALLALAYWGQGGLEDAFQTFSKALGEMAAGGREMDVIRGTFVLGDLRVAQGRLREAETHYQRGLQLAEASPHAALAEIDELHCGLSELYREWNDLAAATRHLDELSRAEGVAYNLKKHRWSTAMARVSEARGDFDQALAWLDDAERHVRRDPMPRVQPIPALRARMHLLQGRVADAAEWADKARLSVDESLSFAREYEHVTFARVLQAQGRAKDAAQLLDRLHAAAVTAGRVGSVIEILVLQAITHNTLGNQRAALDALAQALSLAEPERYLRVFLDEGVRLRDLLRTATARGLTGGYARRVLAAFDAPLPAPPVVSATGEPVQALTARELEILRLIASGMRNQEIADELSISTATVKRHIANAYGKLGAGHRTEALARAKELRLL